MSPSGLEVRIHLTEILSRLQRHCQHNSIDQDPSEVLTVLQREQLYFYLAQECSSLDTIDSNSSILCTFTYEMLYVLLSQLTFDILFPASHTQVEPEEMHRNTINIPAMSTLAYVLSGLWIPDDELVISSKEEAAKTCTLTLNQLQECVYSVPELAMNLMDLLNSKLMVVKKLVLFLLYTQNINHWLELDELQMIIQEILSLLLRSEAEGWDGINIAVLRVVKKLLSQYPADFEHLEVGELLEMMTKRFFPFAGRELATVYSKDETRRAEFSLLNDCLQLFPSSTLKGLLPLVLAQSKLISKSISDLLGMKQVSKEHKLFVSEAIWCFWLKLLSLLLDQGQLEVTQQHTVQSVSLQMDKTRKKMMSSCTAADVETQQMHIITFGKSADATVEALSSHWIARVQFYELLAPKQGAGYLVLPLQPLLKLSRLAVSKCYLQLIQTLVRWKKWYSPSGGMKLLLRCINHLLTSIPPSLAVPTSYPTANCTTVSMSAKEFAEYSESVFVGTEMLAVYLKHIDREDWDYVYNTSVTIGNKSATQSGVDDTARASLSALLHRLEQLVCEDDSNLLEVADSAVQVVTSRLKPIRRSGWLCLRDCVQNHQAMQHSHWLANNNTATESAHIHHPQGLFGLKQVFQKSDLVQLNISAAGKNVPVELSSKECFAGLDQCTQHMSATISFSSAENSCQDEMTLNIIRTTLHACVNDWQRNVYFLAFDIFRQLHQLDQQQGSLGTETTGWGGLHNPLISTPLSFYMSTPMDYLHPPSHGNSSFVITTTAAATAQACSPWKVFCSLEEQANSQLEEMLPRRNSEQVEQLVLASSIPLVVQDTESFLSYSLQLCKLLHDAVTSTSKIPAQIRSELLAVHAYVVEAMWWFLHRTTTFHVDFTSDTMTELFSRFTTHGEQDGHLPDIAVGMVFGATLIHCQLLSSLAATSSTVREQAEHQLTLLSSALSCSINSMTESGVLPLIAGFLPPFLSQNFLHPRNSLFGNSNYILVLVAFFTANVFQKFSSMVQPTMSEQADDELMKTLVEGLRPILLLPMLLLMIFQPNSIFNSNPIESQVYMLLALQSTEIQSLCRLWLQLEDFLHRHRNLDKTEAMVTAEIQQLSSLALLQPAQNVIHVQSAAEFQTHRVILMQRLLLIAKVLSCLTSHALNTQIPTSSVVIVKAWITALMKESLHCLIPALSADTVDNRNTALPVGGKLKRKFFGIFTDLLKLSQDSTLSDLLNVDVQLCTSSGGKEFTSMVQLLSGMTLCQWQHHHCTKEAEYAEALNASLQQLTTLYSAQQLWEHFYSFSAMLHLPSPTQEDFEATISTNFPTAASRKRKLDFSAKEGTTDGAREVVDLQSQAEAAAVAMDEDQEVVDEDETCHSVQQLVFPPPPLFTKSGTTLKRQATPAANCIRNPVDGSEIKLKRIRQGFAPLTYTSVDRHETPQQSQLESQSQCLSPALLTLSTSLLPPKPVLPPVAILPTPSVQPEENKDTSKHSLSPTASNPKDKDHYSPPITPPKEVQAADIGEPTHILLPTTSIQREPSALLRDVQRLLGGIEDSILITAATTNTTSTDVGAANDSTSRLYEALQASHQLSSTIAQIILQQHRSKETAHPSQPLPPVSNKDS